MTILDRYLYAVRTNLPNDRRDDIAAEIGDELQSQIDERESELGRPLTEDEQAAIVKAYGHPAVVAARYAKVQYLIGPELLPLYWSVLRIVLTVVVAVELLAGAAASILLHDGQHFFAALGDAVSSLVWIFSIVTIAFAFGERAQADGARPLRFSPRWDPRRLPVPGAQLPVPRFSALAEFIANFLVLLVLLDAPNAHHRIPLDSLFASVLAALHAVPTAAWYPALVGVCVGTALLALSSIVLFVRPQLSGLHEFVRALSSASSVAGIAVTLASGPLIESRAAGINTAALYTLGAAVIILGAQFIVSVSRLTGWGSRLRISAIR